jgi:dihydrofolate reductase
MRKLTVFNFITLNGYFEGPQKGDTSWHTHGKEESDYALNMLKLNNTLLFGRVTYEHMKSYWPTHMAMEQIPEMAKGMNQAEKIVFSNTLKTADWNNTRIIKGNIFEEIIHLKKTGSKDLTVLGSGTIVTQFAEQGLVDKYQVMIDPVAISGGTPVFNKIGKKLALDLKEVKTFKTGVVLLTYSPL